MRRACQLACATASLAGVLVSQIHVKRVIPRVLVETEEEAGLRQRIGTIIDREVRNRFEYELFIKDMTDLGRAAVPYILEISGDAVSDRYVTESLLRIGGTEVCTWVETVLGDSDRHWREAFIGGVPSVVHVDGSVRNELAKFLLDKTAQVRVLAIEKLYRLVPAHRLFALCRDRDRNVVRTAVETVSKRWLFLDHGRRELRNLEEFVGILETYYRDTRWDVGRGFALAFHKEHIARSEKGRELRRRVSRLPWFKRAGQSLPIARLKEIRTALQKPDAEHAEIITKALARMSAGESAELLQVLADESDAAVRYATCSAGLTLLDPELAASFVRFLKDPNEAVRKKARELLEQTSFYVEQRERWRG